MVVAHVIGQTCGRGVGEHIGGDKVLPTHFERVKAQFAAHLIDHTLQAIGRLGAACATIGIDRSGVGEHGFHVHIDVGHLIRPRHQCAVQESRRHGREVRQIGPHVRHRFGAKRDERAVFFASQFNLGDMVAAMRVGQEAFRTLGHPLDGLFDLFGCGQNQGLFAIVIDLRPKAAAHIGGHDLQLVFRNPQHKGRNQKARQVGVLAGGGQLVIARARIELADRSARFHGVGDQAVVDQFQRGDMGRRFDGRIHFGAVVFDPAPVKALVVGDLVMHAVGVVSQSLRHVDDGGQFFEI